MCDELLIGIEWRCKESFICIHPFSNLTSWQTCPKFTSQPHFNQFPLGLGALTNYLQQRKVGNLVSHCVRCKAFRSWSFSGFPMENQSGTRSTLSHGVKQDVSSNRMHIILESTHFMIASGYCTAYASGDTVLIAHVLIFFWLIGVRHSKEAWILHGIRVVFARGSGCLGVLLRDFGVWICFNRTARCRAT